METRILDYGTKPRKSPPDAFLTLGLILWGSIVGVILLIGVVGLFMPRFE